MIFITSGTTTFPFRRLEDIVINVHNKFPRQKIIFQSKAVSGGALPDNIQVKKLIAPKEFIDIISQATLIITHAGYGTVMEVLRHSKTKPYLVPRLKKFKEHVNDHQKYFTDYMVSKGVVKKIVNKNNLDHVKLNDRRNVLIVKKYLDGVNLRKKLLIKYLDKVTKDLCEN